MEHRLCGSNRGLAQMLFEEGQRFRPGITVSHGVVAVAMLIHERMVGPRIGIKLVHLAKPAQFGIEFAHVGG